MLQYPFPFWFVEAFESFDIMSDFNAALYPLLERLFSIGAAANRIEENSKSWHC